MTRLMIDSAHSQVGFQVKHMMFSKVRGTFEEFSGTIEFDETNPANSSVNVEINPASINTRDEKRDEHMRSADFFGVDANPKMTFVSTDVKPDGDDYKITGDLTMNGITKSVVLDAEFEGKGPSPMGVEVYGFSAETKISRKEFGMEWNAAIETGGVLVSDEVKITLEIEANPAQ